MVEKEIPSQHPQPSVNVAGVHYKVETKEYLELDGDRNLFGLCEYEVPTISLISSLKGERRDEVFVHEVLHAIFNEAQYQEQDEEEISRIGRVLYQVLRDNDFSFLRRK